MEASSAAWFSGMCLADVDEMLIDVNPMKENIQTILWERKELH